MYRSILESSMFSLKITKDTQANNQVEKQSCCETGQTSTVIWLTVAYQRWGQTRTDYVDDKNRMPQASNASNILRSRSMSFQCFWQYIFLQNVYEITLVHLRNVASRTNAFEIVSNGRVLRYCSNIGIAHWLVKLLHPYLDGTIHWIHWTIISVVLGFNSQKITLSIDFNWLIQCWGDICSFSWSGWFIVLGWNLRKSNLGVISTNTFGKSRFHYLRTCSRTLGWMCPCVVQTCIYEQNYCYRSQPWNP